jgi:hypothetical protein
MISVICPSRGRPHMIAQLKDSIFSTARGEVELLVGLDDDDVRADEYSGCVRVVGPRTSLGTHYNRMLLKAQGDILMMTGDDMHFRTPGWDSIVESKAAQYLDGIYYIYGDVEHGVRTAHLNYAFVSRRLTEKLGYLAPSFLNRYIDNYLSAVGKKIDRLIHVPIVVEHLHSGMGKRSYDATDSELNARLGRDRAMFSYTDYMREADAAILRPLLKRSPTFL